jgi:PhnB protein
MLSVRNGSKAVEFYKQAFGARELFLIKSDSGDVVAQLAVEGADFWVADESPENKNFSPESLSPQFRGVATVRMVMVVADPDAVFARAVKAGAAVMSPVEDKEYGWRVGRLVDPFGHHWEIGKALA